MKYIELIDNFILGCYDDNSIGIPIKCIPVEDDIWSNALDINANYYENGKFIRKEFRLAEEIEKQRVLDIKAKAGKIITSRYSIIKQMNIYGEGGEAQLEMTTWIKKIRDISNRAEADGTALADINWEI